MRLWKEVLLHERGSGGPPPENFVKKCLHLEVLLPYNCQNFINFACLLCLDKYVFDSTKKKAAQVTGVTGDIAVRTTLTNETQLWQRSIPIQFWVRTNNVQLGSNFTPENIDLIWFDSDSNINNICSIKFYLGILASNSILIPIALSLKILEFLFRNGNCTSLVSTLVQQMLGECS